MVRLSGFATCFSLRLFSFPGLPLASAAAKTSLTLSTSTMAPAKHEMAMFGDVRNDDYYWLRDDSRSNPEVTAYLNEENAYTDLVMKDSKETKEGESRKMIYLHQYAKGSHYYYQRTLEGKESVQRCRQSFKGASPFCF